MRQIVCKAVPPSPNELRRKYKHWGDYKRLREAWKNEIFYSVNASGRKQLCQAAQEGKMVVRVTIHHTREYDPDNVVGSLKPILDALVGLGFLRDDSSEWLELSLPVAQTKTAHVQDNKTEIWIGRAETPLRQAA